MAPDRRSLIVANGGIDTDPASGRDILNPDSMRPSLSRLDLASGSITDLVELASHYRQLSIRHLSIDAAGRCWFGCQWEGDRLETPPLVGRLSDRNAIDLFDAPNELRHATRNYVGAMAASPSGGLIAASCPKGGLIMLWDTAKGSFLRAVELTDGCGVAEFGAGILATSGEGQIKRVNRVVDSQLPKADVKFDNHLRRFALA